MGRTEEFSFTIETDNTDKVLGELGKLNRLGSTISMSTEEGR